MPYSFRKSPLDAFRRLNLSISSVCFKMASAQQKAFCVTGKSSDSIFDVLLWLRSSNVWLFNVLYHWHDFLITRPYLIHCNICPMPSRSCFDMKILSLQDWSARNLFCSSVSSYWLYILVLIDFPYNLEINLVTFSLYLCNSIVYFCCFFCGGWKHMQSSNQQEALHVLKSKQKEHCCTPL